MSLEALSQPSPGLILRGRALQCELNLRACPASGPGAGPPRLRLPQRDDNSQAGRAFWAWGQEPCAEARRQSGSQEESTRNCSITELRNRARAWSPACLCSSAVLAVVIYLPGTSPQTCMTSRVALILQVEGHWCGQSHTDLEQGAKTLDIKFCTVFTALRGLGVGHCLEERTLTGAGGNLAAQRPEEPGGGCISQDVLGSK